MRGHRPDAGTCGSVDLMQVDKLMRELDRLDHHERVATLIERARKLPAPELDALCDGLGRGDVAQRLLALHVARLRDDLRFAWRLLDDASLAVRGFAARLIGRRAATIPADTLDRLDAASLALLMREVCRRPRTPDAELPARVAEGLVEGLLARERLGEAAVLLPRCRPTWIAAHLDDVAWPEVVWMRLARYRSALMVELIAAMFEREQERPDLVWRRFGAALWCRLAHEQPRVVMAWVDRHADVDALPVELSSALPLLLRVDPSWMVRTLATRIAYVARSGLPRGLSRRAREVADAELEPLCRGLARVAPLMLGQLLAQLPYPRRGALFEHAVAPLDTTRIEWPSSLLAVLPTPQRDREAARMLGLARAVTDASWRRELLGMREISEVRELLERESRAAQASDRAEAHAALIRSSKRSRAGMPETLAWLGRLRNEQDPVRMVILQTLTELPGHRFDDPAALELVIAPLFDARDTSHSTRAYAARIAQRLMVAHATFPSSPCFAYALQVLERLAGQQGTPDLPDLSRNLPRGAELRIVDALLPWIEAAEQRQQTQHLFRLWYALGKRAWNIPALAKLLATAIWQGSKSSAGWYAEQWIRDPATRDERVRELVKRDRSALYLAGVFNHCHRRRQTLLVDRFAAAPPRGRFHDGKLAIVPHVTDGFARWSTPLQRLYLEFIATAEASPKQFSTTRASLVALRAYVPLTRVEDLGAALASKEVPVQEAALAALVWVDDPSPALPILLEHLDGDRARVAMYAMPRLARLMPRSRMVDALAELLARPKLKVTVHKEALRLLGQLATPHALALLRATWAQPLHRDVRIATMHAARALLSQPDAWLLLGEAARDPDEDIARALVETPMHTIAQAHRGRYLATMLGVGEHPSMVARAALFTALLQGWASVDPLTTSTLAAALLTRLELHDPWRHAAQLLALATRSSAAHDAIVQCVTALREAAARDVTPAGERDRMADQRLAYIVEQLATQRHPTAILVLERLAALLLAVPECWPQGARLRIAAAANAELAATCLPLLAHAPTPRQALALEQAARAAALLDVRDWSDGDALAQVRTLAREGGELIALALLASFGPRWGWGSAWTDELARLRDHANLDVRVAARSLWMATS